MSEIPQIDFKSNCLYLDGYCPFVIQIKYLENCAYTDENRYHNHFHNGCEIYINLEGNVSFVVEDQVYQITPGSVIITRPNEAHHCVYHDHSIHKHFCITFSSEGNEQYLGQFFKRQAGRDNRILLSKEREGQLFDVCENMLTDEENSVRFFAHFFMLLDLLNNGKVKNELQSGRSAEIQQALQYIREHLSEKISIEELSNNVHLSVSTFERNFKKEIGMTPSKYILERRLSLSATYLSNGCTVNEASEKCGFPDYSHFIACFKKRFGKTPLQYKKN